MKELELSFVRVYELTPPGIHPNEAMSERAQFAWVGRRRKQLVSYVRHCIEEAGVAVVDKNERAH